MPTVHVNDITMYYEIHGTGEPLVLIGGLANDVTDYTDHSKIISELAQKYQVIAFDNRGVGRTDKPDIPYTIEMMEHDTVELLRALHIKQASVIGVSMGGRIALTLALEHPEMVKKLMLVSTAAKVQRTWRRRFITAAPRLRLFQGRYTQPYYAFLRQSQAADSFDCTNRLAEIHIPTLILHGKQDRLVPYYLAEEMHTLIGNSRIETFKGGHIFFMFQQDSFIQSISNFCQ